MTNKINKEVNVIGFQEYVINNNININNLAQELNTSISNIYQWFNANKVSKKFVKILAEKFNLPQEYINKIVNNVSTHQPRKKGFNQYKIVDNYVIIYLSGKKNKGFVTYIDLEDLEKVKEYNLSWNASWREDVKNYYAVATQYLGMENGKSKSKVIYLHRLIFDNPERNIIIDHKEGDKTLDNRKSNLRVTIQDKNLKHRNGANINNKSGYRNVCWIRNKWCVQLQVNGKNTKLGFFDDVDEAGKFAEKMRQKYYGEFKGKDNNHKIKSK
jgi:hypothetical protein